jgi:hypothetical protein
MKKLIAIALATLLSILPVATMADAISFDTTVDKYMTATFNYAAVSYGNLAAGSNNTAAANQLTGAYNVSVDTNYDYDVLASGTDFDDGGGQTFYIGNLTMDTKNVAANLLVGEGTPLTNDEASIDTGYTTADTYNYHGFWLSIPAAQYANFYSSTVTITVENE